MVAVTTPGAPTQAARIAERKRQLVRDELVVAALGLLANQGFDDTTIEQIVAAAGVSRRTFFRYFRSKEDVVVAFIGDLGTQMGRELAARPAEERPATALREALRTFVETYRLHPEKTLALSRLIFGTPAVRARYLERQDGWRDGLVVELARRTGVSEDDLRPALSVAVALAAFDTVLGRWCRDGGKEDLGRLVDEALRRVAPALDLAGPANG